MTDSIKKNWENLFVPELVLQAIEKENFVKPTEIQKLTLPFAIRDKLDILGAAATGTGKTLAFGIPMVARILEDRKKEMDAYETSYNAEDNNDDEESDVDMEEEEDTEQFDMDPSGSELEDTWNDDDIKPEIAIGIDMFVPKVDTAKPYRHIYGLVLTPTRELACQVADHLKKVCQFTDLKVCAIFGGMSVEKQQRLLSYRPEILVVTPGRFWSFINDQDLHALSAANMSVLVFDEADRLLESGHFEEVNHLLEWIRTNEQRTDRQTFVFSATLTFVHSSGKNDQKKVRTKDEKLRKIVSELGMKGIPKIIDTTLDVTQLKQWKILCPTQPDKDSRLFWFLRHHPGRTIVFVNSKNSVRRLTSVLQQLGLRPKSLFADMTEKQRLKNLESFSKNMDSLMIASDVAARGLDIPRVDFVIHFDVAHTAETHLHRSGRTARAQHPGHSIIMLCPKEMGQLRKLLFSLKKSENDIALVPIKDIDFIEKIVALARKMDSENHVATKVEKDKEWFTKMAEEADLVLDDEIAPVLRKLSADKKAFGKMKTELASMIEKLNQTVTEYESPISACKLSVSDGNDHVATVVMDQPMLRAKKNKKKNTKVKGINAPPEKKPRLD